MHIKLVRCRRFFCCACGGLLTASVAMLAAYSQPDVFKTKQAQNNVWEVPTSEDQMPHFQKIQERRVFFVDGRPFTVLAVEIPWWGLVYGNYVQTENAYDDLYPAARAMGLNALKVPVKWSTVEPREGVYDFSYVDHVRVMAQKYHLKLILDWFGHYASGDGNIYRNLTGEMFAPYYIVRDESTYPRAVDGNGVLHHNAASYAYPAIINREMLAFRAFMKHIREIDSKTHTILMIQVENEISVFGDYPHDATMWRDRSAASDKLFTENGFTNDLEYSAWELSHNWIRPLTNAGAEMYPIPFVLNFVAGRIGVDVVGGEAGEDVATYLRECQHVAFIGLNLYAPSDISSEDLRNRLAAYNIGRNIPAVTETNSGPGPVAPRIAYIAVSDFGSPIVSPWALTVSSLSAFKPYVSNDGTLGNGAFALRDTFTSLSKALPQVSYYGGTKDIGVFMSYVPGKSFSYTKSVNGAEVTVSGVDNGQALVIHPSGNSFLIIGYRCWVNFRSSAFQWPTIKQVRVERGYFTGNEWKEDGEPDYTIDQTRQELSIQIDAPQVLRVSW